MTAVVDPPAAAIAQATVDVTFGDPLLAVTNLVLFAVLSVIAAGVAAVTYRWYFREAVPEGIAILFGVAIVALYLNTASLGVIVGGEELELLQLDAVLFNVVSLGVAALVSPVGQRAGDALATNVFALTGAKQLEGEMSRVVRTVGRVTAVTLPAAEEIEDMDSYEPVAPETKAEMGEKTLLFPRRLTVEELRDRLVTRVKEDYGVGYVDLDLTEDGTIEYFAVGSRASGIGPTLAPGAAAVAVKADPANSATPGDMVQVWRGGDSPERIATAELRATADDVATLALDEGDAAKLDDQNTYRLVTLPAEPQADREFASLLRTADETMTAVTVGAGSELVGTAVDDVAAVVAAVRPPEGTVDAIPPRAYTFGTGDTVYLVGRPDELRRFESAAAPGPVASESEGEAPDGTGGGSPPEAGGGDPPEAGGGDSPKSGDGDPPKSGDDDPTGSGTKGSGTQPS